MGSPKRTPSKHRDRTGEERRPSIVFKTGAHLLYWETQDRKDLEARTREQKCSFYHRILADDSPSTITKYPKQSIGCLE